MLKAKDIMRTDVTAVSEDMTVEDLGRTFIEKNITGLPVAGPDGELSGVVTENDLISQNKKLHIPTVLRIFDAIIPLEGSGAFEREIKKMAGRTVSDICTREPITITEDTSIEEIATIMSEKNAHHLPVLKDGKLVGMVGQHDVIKGVSG
jgi:CBS domain-containing protein